MLDSDCRRVKPAAKLRHATESVYLYNTTARYAHAGRTYARAQSASAAERRLWKHVEPIHARKPTWSR